MSSSSQNEKSSSSSPMRWVNLERSGRDEKLKFGEDSSQWDDTICSSPGVPAQHLREGFRIPFLQKSHEDDGTRVWRHGARFLHVNFQGLHGRVSTDVMLPFSQTHPIPVSCTGKAKAVLFRADNRITRKTWHKGICVCVCVGGGHDHTVIAYTASCGHLPFWTTDCDSWIRACVQCQFLFVFERWSTVLSQSGAFHCTCTTSFVQVWLPWRLLRTDQHWPGRAWSVYQVHFRKTLPYRLRPSEFLWSQTFWTLTFSFRPREAPGLTDPYIFSQQWTWWWTHPNKASHPTSST